MLTPTALIASGWLDDAVEALPGTQDALFKRVWQQRLLLFDGQPGVQDLSDDLGARLVAAAVVRGAKLMLSLPDRQPHRPAFLLATALIRQFLDAQAGGSTRTGPVLYFGATIGIREQLRRTSVKGLHLSLGEVFEQDDVKRGSTVAGRSPARGASSGLPKMVTVYAPAEPAEILRRVAPSWIAIDCSDAASIAWLTPLLEEADRRNTPVVAWTQNCLSSCLDDFRPWGAEFTFPPKLRRAEPDPESETIEALILPTDTLAVTPYVIQSPSAVRFSEMVSTAAGLLATVGGRISGPFERDAVSVHWRYLRALETLCVPIDFFEAEAANYWGLQSLNRVGAACQQFRLALDEAGSSLLTNLESAAQNLDAARHVVQEHGCDVWEALTLLCLDKEADEAQVLTFDSDARARLFVFAMLARYNTTEDDLRDLGVHVASLRQLRARASASHSRQLNEGDGLSPNLTLVGLPSPSATSRLDAALAYRNVHALIYPHQAPVLSQRQGKWGARLWGDIQASVDALGHLSGRPLTEKVESSESRISLRKAIMIDVRQCSKRKGSAHELIWSASAPSEEMARLFDSEGGDDSFDLTEDSAGREHGGDRSVSRDLWCSNIVRLTFNHGWQAEYDRDETLNVSAGGALEQRYVRSIRVGDQVLLIHGQRRQSLYDLIISRVHKHPSIELHIALIRRWQEDIRISFDDWSRKSLEPEEAIRFGSRDLDGLLRRMREKGSHLTSSLTLGLWLRGLVLCPLDPEDLRRVAEILRMEFAEKHYRRIHQAASRLRGIHRGLSNRLNRWIMGHTDGRETLGTDDVIDSELGLTFGDLENSLLVLRVEQVENLRGTFLQENLGRVRRVEVGSV